MTTGTRRLSGGRRARIAILVVAAIAVVGAGGTATALAVSSGSGTATASPVPPSSSVPPVSSTSTGGGQSKVSAGQSKLISETCRYSHTANDDPILAPGKTGQSMAHNFFGNTTTSASSTASGLVGGSTTCSTGADASAYWTPVLYQNGNAVTPTHNLIYWSGLHTTNPVVTVPPAGLEMIAGNENATGPQSTRVVDWRCANQIGSDPPTSQTPSAPPVSCAGTKGMELRITFPSCWDGTTLNGANQTNVVYPQPGGTCPSDHPVRIPTVIFHVLYPITSDAGLTLSMGPGQQGSTDTAHGDFINGWSQSTLTRLITGCAGAAHHCGHLPGSAAVVHPRTTNTDHPGHGQRSAATRGASPK